MRSAWSACWRRSIELDLEQVRRTGDAGPRGLGAARSRLFRAVSDVRGAGVMLGVRRGARRLAGCAARPRVPARPRAAAGRRAHAAVLSALRHRALRDRRGARDPAHGRGRHRRGRAREPGGDRARRSASGRSSARSRRSTCRRSHRREASRSSRPRSWRSRSSATARCAVSARRPARRARPLLQLPAEVLEATLANDGRDRRGAARRRLGRIVAYALGSPLENHDEEGRRARIPPWREQHVLPAGDGHAAVGEEPGRDREPAARIDPRSGARGRLRDISRH